MKIEQISHTVHLVEGTNVNWALVTDGDALTVVDAGYPNDGDTLVRSIRAIGRHPADVVAIVLTHAHLDHMGGIPALLSQHESPVLTGTAEAPHARREYLEQISPVQMLAQCYRPRGIRWVAQTLRAVLPHARMSVPQAQAVPHDVSLDIPGGLVPVGTPGHTSGHTSYLLPGEGVLFSGDALVTAHPLLGGRPRPQLLPGFFSEDTEQIWRSVKRLGDLDADILAPGHGPASHGTMSSIAAQAVRAAEGSAARTGDTSR